MATEEWDPTAFGAIRLRHRLVMAPMTRDRSEPDGVPSDLNVEYYGQRASMGLIITEGTQPSADGQGYMLTPGIHTDAHVAGWRRVTDAVHEGGGHIVIQLMHVGRMAHPDNTPHGRQPVAPSPVAPDATMVTVAGEREIPVPRALSTEEVRRTIEDYRHAAAAAIRAGADGVEIHGANGYLVHQFLSDNVNQRADEYGNGSVADRIRFAVEVAGAVAAEIGADRVGLQISPGNPLNDIVERDTATVYGALVQALTPLSLAYLNFIDGGDDRLLRDTREAWPTALLLNRGGSDPQDRIDDVRSGRADAVSFGRLALANPDLAHRIRSGAPCNEPDPDTFYGGGAHGYTDYPSLGPDRDQAG